MRVLVVKMSSLGDLLHTLPALTDAQRQVSDLRVDWVVEEGFAEIPSWHPSVQRVIPVSLRQWRHEPVAAWRSGRWQAFLHSLRRDDYDLVVDAQGLLKSAVIARLARGTRWGFDRRSAREALAAWAYRHTVPVQRRRHAIRRLRELFAAALAYPFQDTVPDYGISERFPRGRQPGTGYLVFMHGTSWPSKHWPLPEWRRLAALASAAGWRIRLPWATAQERLRAERIAAAAPGVEVLPGSGLDTLAVVASQAGAVVGVDTGLAHLAAALGVPSVTLYGPTDPELTGTLGERQRWLQAEYPCAPCRGRVCARTSTRSEAPPCYQGVPAERVWEAVRDLVVEDT